MGKDNGTGKCFACTYNDIRSSSFECGHIVAVACGGENTIENLRPVCAACNKSMGKMNLDDYKKMLKTFEADTPKPPSPGKGKQKTEVKGVTRLVGEEKVVGASVAAKTYTNEWPDLIGRQLEQLLQKFGQSKYGTIDKKMEKLRKIIDKEGWTVEQFKSFLHSISSLKYFLCCSKLGVCWFSNSKICSLCDISHSLSDNLVDKNECQDCKLIG
jgi:hypothetical protein